MKTIMIIDDEKKIRDSLEGVLRDEGYGTRFAESVEQAIPSIADSAPDLILLDIWLPGMDGVEGLKEIKKLYPGLPVIMITGHGTVEIAVKTTKFGAYDFLEKPLSIEKVILTIAHALEETRLIEENKAYLERERKEFEIIGISKAVEKLKENILKVSHAYSSVLITGENGTGKELVARNIHSHSARHNKPFIAVNCAAMPDTLIESELFGYEKEADPSRLASMGSQGAVLPRKGKFDMADGSTLFLDEIGDMGIMTQAKILRILEEKSFERVGGTKPIGVDVRVLAATNKDLIEEVKKGKFREDLYYRLNVLSMHVPPIRERKEDIPIFVEYFIKKFAIETGIPLPQVSPDSIQILLNYRWPGNVRELRNLIERLVIMTSFKNITPADIPPYIKGGKEASQPETLSPTTLKEARKDFEREFIIKKLEEFSGNIARTASSLGIERNHLYRKIKSYGIETQ